MTKRYADFDNKGKITGFYSDDVNFRIPAQAVLISDEVWRDARRNTGKYLISEGKVVLAPPPSAEDVEKEQKRVRSAQAQQRLIEIDQETIRVLREYVAHADDCPKEVVDLEAEAEAERKHVIDNAIGPGNP